MASALRNIALAGSPAASGTTAGLAAYRVTHHAGTALQFAALAGVLTLVTLITIALAQLAENWIRHRSEHHFSYAIKCAVKIATGAADSERRVAALTAAQKLGINYIAEGTLRAMEITRQDKSENPTVTMDRISTGNQMTRSVSPNQGKARRIRPSEQPHDQRC